VTLADMTSDERERGRTAVITLALFLASLVALRLGRFIQFDDQSGFGDADMVMPLGALAVLLALGALVTSLKSPMARRSLGGALAILDAAIVAIAATDDGFRFFWTTYEGELLQFEVVLGITALVLLVPSYVKPAAPSGSVATEVDSEPGLTAWARASIYLCAIAGVTFIAFVIGTAHFEATQCSGPDFGAECDLAGLEGLLWAAGALLLGVVAIVVAEVVRAARRRTGRTTAGVS
jgi:hypothetical protein